MVRTLRNGLANRPSRPYGGDGADGDRRYHHRMARGIGDGRNRPDA